jgi:transposase
MFVPLVAIFRGCSRQSSATDTGTGSSRRGRAARCTRTPPDADAAPGWSGACVRTWPGEQSGQFRAGIELVVIDPSAPYASGIRAALPRARIAVDRSAPGPAGQRHGHRGPPTRHSLHQRRGLASDPVWAHRRMLHRRQPLSRKQRRVSRRAIRSPAAWIPHCQLPPSVI